MTTPKPQHSPEPWRQEPQQIVDANDEWVTFVEDDSDDARRIVAAVNAVAGIPVEALESGALAKALDGATAILRDGPSEVSVSILHAALRALGRLP